MSSDSALDDFCSNPVLRQKVVRSWAANDVEYVLSRSTSGVYGGAKDGMPNAPTGLKLTGEQIVTQTGRDAWAPSAGATTQAYVIKVALEWLAGRGSTKEYQSIYMDFESVLTNVKDALRQFPSSKLVPMA